MENLWCQVGEGSSNDQWTEELPHYEHIERNDFIYRKHKKQKEEDIAICECKFNGDDPDSACGERCLNLLTSTECTPGYCPCGVYCKNQVTSILHICVISINPNDYCIPVPFGVHMYITYILVKFLFSVCVDYMLQ